MSLRILAGLILAASWTLSAEAIETARVDATAGVPRLMIDGKPVRARMFWGDIGSRPVVARKNGRQVIFEFSPLADEPATATMHFRFGNEPGDVYLDDIRVVDIATGRDVLPRRTLKAASRASAAGGRAGRREQRTPWEPSASSPARGKAARPDFTSTSPPSRPTAGSTSTSTITAVSPCGRGIATG